MIAEVKGVDINARQVVLDNASRVDYDTLVLATGATHAYFGGDEWEAYAPGLKTPEDAATIRGRILSAFEEAERSNDPHATRVVLIEAGSRLLSVFPEKLSD